MIKEFNFSFYSHINIDQHAYIEHIPFVQWQPILKRAQTSLVVMREHLWASIWMEWHESE